MRKLPQVETPRKAERRKSELTKGVRVKGTVAESLQQAPSWAS